MNQLAFLAISIALVLASIIDIRTRRVPNFITYPGILYSLTWFNSKSAIYISIAIGLLILPANLIGAGDIKLGLFLALWSDHFQWSSQWLLFSLIFGGVAAIFLLFLKKNQSIAFAPYLAIGFFIANFAT